MKLAILVFFPLLLLYGCQDSAVSEFEEQASQLEQRIRKTECKKAGLQRQIDSIWNIAVTAMQQDLPQDLEPGTKANFLELKAEHLLKMLPEYSILKANTKQLISQAAGLDSLLTLQFNTLLKDYAANEAEMKIFLQQVETKAPELRRKYLKQLQSAQKETCDTQ